MIQLNPGQLNRKFEMKNGSDFELHQLNL